MEEKELNEKKEMKFDIEEKPKKTKKIKEEEKEKDEIKDKIEEIKDKLPKIDKKPRKKKEDIQKEEEMQSMMALFTPTVSHIMNIVFVRLKWNKLTELEEENLSRTVMALANKWLPWLFSHFFEEINLLFILSCIIVVRLEFDKKGIDDKKEEITINL